MGNWEVTEKSSDSSNSELKEIATQEQIKQSLINKRNPKRSAMNQHSYDWWLTVCVNIIILLAGQTAATLLNRYYYDQGGNSKWLETLTFSAAFPILYIPLLFFNSSPSSLQTYDRPSPLKLSLVYIAIGLITAADSLMYSYGLLYLNVSTYSLITATQLAFNAIFSYVINSEKFTHQSLNSVVLLSLSAAVVGVSHESSSASVDSSKGNRVPLGFLFTLVASAAYSLNLSLIELSFDKVIKSRSFSAVLNMQIYTALVSTVMAVIGLYASGEWNTLKGEIEGFKKGKLGWAMTVVWSSIAWQVTDVGLVALIFKVSSLFSNVISTVAIPIAPIFAMILFGDKVDGIKVVALLLALWGFVSYFYQHYLDYKSEKQRVVEMEDEIIIDK